MTPWTAACQAFLSITISWNLLKLMSIESVMPSNNLILCCPLLLLPLIFPSISVFPMSQFFTSVQFSSVAQSCPILCDPMNRSTPGLPVHRQLLEFTQTHSCIGEGNGNPLQCSCLENARDGGAWWAAIYGVTQSRTQLKQLSIA